MESFGLSILISERTSKEFWKAPVSIISTELEIFTVFNFSHSLKAQIPILLTESGIETLVKFLQLLNAYCWIETTDSGMVILVIEDPKNA